MPIGKQALEEKQAILSEASEKYKYFTLAEIVPLVGLSRSTLLKYCKNGRIKAKKIGLRWRVAKTDLDEFLATGDPEIPSKPKENLVDAQVEGESDVSSS